MYSHCLVCQTVGNRYRPTQRSKTRSHSTHDRPNSLNCVRTPAQPKQNIRRLNRTSRICIGTFAQSDLFADVTCHLEMFSLFMQAFEARLAMRKFKPRDATWPKSFEGAKLQVGLCIESLADCCVCKSL